jgi:predicted transcriptional regulator
MNSHLFHHRHRSLGDVEQAVMNHVWSHGPVSADTCRHALHATRPMKESTIRTVLRRLEAKGYVTHVTEGRTFIYQAAEAPVNVAARAAQQLIDRFCDGSAEALVIGMVDNAVLSAGQLERLARKIATRKGQRK